LPTEPPDPAHDTRPAWSLGTRILFRFTFCLLMSYALCCGHETVFRKLPWIGLRLEVAFEYIFLVPARWLGQHYFHLTGAAAVIHWSAFADRALDWIAAGLMLACALAATLVWSLIDEVPKTRRLAYPLLFEIMRWTLRITLVISILWYGAIKIFPIQMESPSLAVLNERVGDTSPMTMLWTVLGMNRSYEITCGVVETLSALLLLFRRTALAGALLAIVVLTNILLFDIFFDVAVRLYAFGLLLMALTLVVPDAHALLRFFFLREPAMSTATWGLPDAAALVFEVCLFLSAFKPIFGQERRQTARELANERHPATIAGQWHIDNSTAGAEPLRGGNGEFITDVFLEPSGRINLRSTDRRLWGGGDYDAAAHKLIAVAGMRGVQYNVSQPDPDHLTLTPTSGSGADPTLSLTRVPLPSSYPLLDRIHEHSLHLVEEWGFLR
jgi:hypothetical protein